MKTTPSTEERVWAVLSHLSALAFGMGILLPIVGWSEQRRKSKYASFQCLQALGYQSLGYTVWLLGYLLIMIVFLVIMVVALNFSVGGGKNMDIFMGIWMSILLSVAFGIFGIYLLLPVVAAVACAFGKDFRFPIMGNRLARYLGYDVTRSLDEQTLIEDHEDRWVAAMGHFSVIILLWGILAPLTVWILQGERSLFMKFQSIQTFVYQALATLLYIVGMAIYMFGFFVFMALSGLGGGNGLSSSTGMVGMGVLLISMLFAIGIVLLLPLFHIIGQWAGYRVLKGDNYRYPLVGKIVEKTVVK